jgi:hypothetical protein
LSIVDVERDRQFFTSQVGLPDPVAEARQTPLSHSFCQYVRFFDTQLIVEDSRQDSILKHNLAVRDLDVIAYLGIPVHAPDGTSIGSFCVIDDRPREWTTEQIEIVRELAATADTLIEHDAEHASMTRCRVALKSETRRVRLHFLPLIVRFDCHRAYASCTPLRDVINRSEQTLLLLEGAQ